MKLASPVRHAPTDSAGFILGLAVVLIGWAGAALGGPTLQSASSLMLLHLVLVLSLYCFVGLTGILSFGHAAFMVVGAYACGIATMSAIRKDVFLQDAPAFVKNFHVDTFTGLVLAAMAALLLVVLLGWPLMRLDGIAASIATLSLLLIVRTIAISAESVTGGFRALVIERFISPWLLAVTALAAVVVTLLISRSDLGLRAGASRDEMVAAQALGINVVRHRRILLALSGIMSGVGGALYAHFLGSLGPNTLYIDLTFLTLAMLVIGGMYRVEGAVLGVLVVSVMAELLDRLETGVYVGINITGPAGTRNLVFALMLILVLILRPEGLIGRRDGSASRKLVPGRRRNRPAQLPSRQPSS